MTNAEFTRFSAHSFDSYASTVQRRTHRELEAVRAELGGPATSRSERDLWYVIASEQVDIGYLWVQLSRNGESAFLFDIQLVREKRGHGLGQAAMTRCIQGLRAAGIKSLRLSVFDDNLAARSLYASMGFRIERIQPERASRALALAIDSV